MRRAIKGLLGQGLSALHLDSWLLRDGAVIVAFHRVQPSDGKDSLTMPVSDFETYCRYFRRHFDVVGLQEIVSRLAEKRSLDRTLAITFDDGYQDNFEYAAPILEKFNLPATFFVVTQWMGTQIDAWWDRERCVKQAWMTWPQVRELHDRGFEIGTHTETHADLGTVSEQEAWQELLGSRLRLEDEIGAPVRTFAYPYGRPENITPAVEQLVQQAGYSCCCASYGGVNHQGANRFHLLRIPVAPDVSSPHQFTFDVAFGRTQLSV